MDDEQATSAVVAEAEMVAKREAWVTGSIPQLRRIWSGRCVTCANWSATSAKSDLGDCSKLTAKATNKQVNVGDGSAVTAAAFGCVLWSEIKPKLTDVETKQRDGAEIAQREISGPIRERVEHAIAIGLMDDVPVETVEG